MKQVAVIEFRNCVIAQFAAKAQGDELALHSHPFDHIMLVTAGKVEVFDDKKQTLVVASGDGAINFPVGRTHGIRALTPDAAFINISPRQVL